ncbi:MAG: hypothetical protein V1726_05530 [Methanobacteriota archaeon]
MKNKIKKISGIMLVCTILAAMFTATAAANHQLCEAVKIPENPTRYLVITAPPTIREGSNLTVRITNQCGIAMQNATVLFCNQTRSTNQNGTAVFSVPSVQNDTIAYIFASKQGYIPARKSILILNWF